MKNWHEFLELCEFERMLLHSIYVYCKYVPDSKRKGTLTEEAFIEFKYMWM